MRGSLSRALARERFAITYRPEIAKLLGDPLSAIILQSVLSHSNESAGKPFPKFYAPCSHPDYIPGTSWTEELAMTRDRFSTALDRISTRTQGASKNNDAALYFDTDGTLINAELLVLVSTDNTRQSWFDVNAAMAEELLCVAYMSDAAQLEYIATHQFGMTVPPLSDLLGPEPEPAKPIKKTRTAKAAKPEKAPKPEKETTEKVAGWSQITEWWCDKGEGCMGRPFTAKDAPALKAILKLAPHYGWTHPELIDNLRKVVSWMRTDSFMSTQITSAYIHTKLPIWWDTVGSKVRAEAPRKNQDELPAYVPVGK